MDELRKELDALAHLFGSFMDDSIKLLDQAIGTLDRLIEDQADGDPWEVTMYGRLCALEDGHEGPHQTPYRAKQSNRGVWVDITTGETITQ